MKKILISVAAVCMAIFMVEACSYAGGFANDFQKHEILSTQNRAVVGTDAGSLIAYCLSDGKISAYDIVEDKKIFDFNEEWNHVGPFYSDGTAIVTDSKGNAVGFVNKKGKITAEISGNYAYCQEYSNGMVCFINKDLQENVYTIMSRKGEIIAENFFEPECELSDQSIIIANEGGGYSRILSDGRVRKIFCNKRIEIEDAVTLYGKTYLDMDGGVHNLNGKLLYKNDAFTSIAPINSKWAVGIKKTETGYEEYVVNIKKNEIKQIETNNVITGYAYTNGDVYEDRAFVGNVDSRVLVDLKTGKILSKPVLKVCAFTNGVCTVEADNGGDRKYRFMKSDGTFMGEEKYDFATDLGEGYALALKKEKEKTIVYAVSSSGEKTVLYVCEPYNNLTIDGQKAEINVPRKNGKDNSINIAKTAGGNLYVGENGGMGDIYVRNKEVNIISRVLSSGAAGVAVLIIVLAAVVTVRRKRKKKAKNNYSE
ncbi:MAG: hypothetical protein Q8873_08815 [Bacillota bacterium]|nr:hypothetical protein [Bacillota bacterium]